ncbi:hypothetical protein PTNB73_00422 [Pyrenophora teres f. teres]|nr:hypothetical protein HRS9139_01664 [Pyrenophora teres f. teres]KAE8851405.1 hypothetical protein HRS9122_01692 [Pyrenophora teres f. teres]KAE8873790.1 hypothetical protein PTNB73_00422 [Pyrenophora teres f. teres]
MSLRWGGLDRSKEKSKHELKASIKAELEAPSEENRLKIEESLAIYKQSYLQKEMSPHTTGWEPSHFRCLDHDDPKYDPSFVTDDEDGCSTESYHDLQDEMNKRKAEKDFEGLPESEESAVYTDSESDLGSLGTTIASKTDSEPGSDMDIDMDTLGSQAGSDMDTLGSQAGSDMDIDQDGARGENDELRYGRRDGLGPAIQDDVLEKIFGELQEHLNDDVLQTEQGIQVGQDDLGRTVAEMHVQEHDIASGALATPDSVSTHEGDHVDTCLCYLCINQALQDPRSSMCPCTYCT